MKIIVQEHVLFSSVKQPPDLITALKILGIHGVHEGFLGMCTLLLLCC